MAGDASVMARPTYVMDVNRDGGITARDALAIVQVLDRTDLTDEAIATMDVSGDGRVSALDALRVINHLGEPEIAPFAQPKAPSVQSGQFIAQFTEADAFGGGVVNQLNAAEVDTLLTRASMATPSNDGIIAVVDRSGRILGVHVEDGVSAAFAGRPKQLAFAIDGAVAKARTAAFFSSNAAPLTSRTVRFISQSTMTQREVQSSPTNADQRFRGPGFVAPIGVGGHFPPEIAFTPQVDLFAIEHQSRDSQTHPGPDRIYRNDEIASDDDFTLTSRFNVDPQFVPDGAAQFLQTWPESYGKQSGVDRTLDSRGIATLPGGVPLYKTTDPAGRPNGNVSETINLVGGIGVFYPGPDGFATHEQGFVHGAGQSERVRTNAPKVLEAEYAALIASAGAGIIGQRGFTRDVADLNARLPALPGYVAINGRIDLVGITLEIFGPTPTRENPRPGIDQLLQLGRSIGTGAGGGNNQILSPDANFSRTGQPVPFGWLVAPHDSPTNSGLTAEVVRSIIDQGVATAMQTRAAIRLDVDNNFRPGVRTAMVLSVADTNGEVLGLFRMKDATIFSIDVSVAKARNTAYYADPVALQPADRVDFNGDGVFDPIQTGIVPGGDTLPLGTAVTNRSLRFLAEPRFPTGTELDPSVAAGCSVITAACLEVGPQSMLRLPNINPLTGENLNPVPLEFNVYAGENIKSTTAFDGFNVGTNLRDPGDGGVRIHGTNILQPLANQNGVVFFPGSTPLYVNAGQSLAGGFGVSGDGVDQDDVVTAGGQGPFAPPQSIRIDSYTIGGVRVPFQKFNRNPLA